MVYYGDEIGMTGTGDPDNRRDMRFDEEVSSSENEVLANFQKLPQIRRQHPALRYGSRRRLAAEKELLALVRAQLDDRVFRLFNGAAKPLEREFQVGPELADGNYVDELSGATATVKEGRMTARVPSRSAAFFVEAQ